MPSFAALFLFLLLTFSLSLVPCAATHAAAAPAQSDAQAPPGDAKASASSSTRKKQTPKEGKGKTAPHASARHMGEALGAGTSWYLDGTPQAGRGAVWERGIPMENLSRKRTLRASGENSGAGPVQGQVHGQARDLAREHTRGQRSTPQSPQAAPGAVAGGKGGVDTTRGIDSALGEISSYERQPADGSALGLKKPGAPSLQMTTEESSWRNPVTQPHTGGQDVMSTRRNVVGAYADVVKSEDLHVTVGPELHIPENDPTVKHLSPQQNDSSTLGIGMKWQWDF